MEGGVQTLYQTPIAGVRVGVGVVAVKLRGGVV